LTNISPVPERPGRIPQWASEPEWHRTSDLDQARRG